MQQCRRGADLCRQASPLQDGLSSGQVRETDLRFADYRSNAKRWETVDFFRGAPRTANPKTQRTSKPGLEHGGTETGSRKEGSGTNLGPPKPGKNPEGGKSKTVLDSGADEVARSFVASREVQETATSSAPGGTRNPTAEREIMQELVADRPLGPDWKGVKVLGSGGNGVASLWEYQGPNTSPRHRRVVIKQSRRSGLREERDIMLRLGDSRSNPHVVHLISLGREYNRGGTYRIMMEFCEGGDMLSLLIKHRQR